MHEDDVNVIKERLDAHDDMATSLDEANERIEFLEKRIVSLEKSCHSSQQHQRGWNLDIDGIPKNIGDDPVQLETAIIEICRGINVDINQNSIDTVHRLPSSRGEAKTVIMRLRSRKDVRLIHQNKSKLKDLPGLNINVAGLTGESRIYIRPSLCPYYNKLAYNCRVLKRNGMIERVHTANDGKLSVKCLDGSFLKVTHETDLLDKFPRFERFNFDE